MRDSCGLDAKFATRFEPRGTLQQRRYEFKYLIDEQQANGIRDFVACHLQLDAHTRARRSIGYAVYSLYLDSVDLKTCDATVRGDKNRFKLRVRFYDDSPTSPVFCEIKRRQGTVILKQRASVRREAIHRLLTGEPADHSYLVRSTTAEFQALQEFCRLRDQLQARPVSYVAYDRVGFELPDNNSVRVTFDRSLKGARYRNELCIVRNDAWSNLKVEGVVLELKFTERFPIWMRELTQWFNLSRSSMPKYVKAVSLFRRE